ncbi:MAG: hypothetical protein ACRDIY_10465 [Chloroflexota bacterium]
MASVKTAISIDEELFTKAEAVAHEMGVSRSEVFARALEEYLRRHESRDLLARVNEALENDAQVEERDTTWRMRRLHRKALDHE